MPGIEKYLLAIAVSALLLWAPGAGGQPYPAKTVRMVVPSAAGGGTDLIGRLLAQMMTFVKSGRLRAIAVTSARRSAILPELPTIAESGYPGYETTTWYGILVRAGTPASIISILNADLARALKLPEIRDRLATEGAEAVSNSPAAFAAFLQAEIERVRKLSKVAVLKLD
jgi:tripartite-type tricarboxylate transporter receptor subunit TctC